MHNLMVVQDSHCRGCFSSGFSETSEGFEGVERKLVVVQDSHNCFYAVLIWLPIRHVVHERSSCLTRYDLLASNVGVQDR